MSKLFDFTDYSTRRRNLFETVKDSVTNAFPVGNSQYTISLSDVDYQNFDKVFSKKDYKDARRQGKTLYKRLSGSYVVTDSTTGDIISKSNKRTLMKVPYLTDHGTFIRGGNEYIIPNQMRLNPGIYSYKSSTGVPTSQFNAGFRQGTSFKMEMDPAKSIFKIRIQGSNIPLYPILKELGVSDESIESSWGSEIFRKNSTQKISPHAYKWIQKITDREKSMEKTASNISRNPHLKKFFNRLALDPETTQTLLGKAYDNVTPDVMLAASKKILGIQRGTETSDDRDSIAHQLFFDESDFIDEAISNDRQYLVKNLLWKVSHNHGDVANVQPNLFEPHLDHLFNEARLAQAVEGYNPLEFYNKNKRVVRLGEGALNDQNAPDSARAVNPSQYGFIDPVKTPESKSIGLDLYFSKGVKKGSDKKIYQMFLNAKTGKKEYINQRKASLSTIGFPLTKESKKQNFVYAIDSDNKIKIVNKANIDYFLPYNSNAFSPSTSLTPHVSGVKSMRAAMGNKFSQSAMPLENREAPLVEGIYDDGSSVLQDLGKHMGIVKADKPGVVTAVYKDHINVRYKDGTSSELSRYNNYILPRKTRIETYANVSAGDSFNKGDVLVHSNFTDSQGNIALGKNLTTAFISYEGKNFEDAVVISSDAAKKLALIKNESMKANKGKDISFDKNKFQVLFPGKYKRKQMESISKNGVVKTGTVLNLGDPVILKTSHRERKLSSLGRSMNIDDSMRWESKTPGRVIEVNDTNEDIEVVIATNTPLKIGDKMTISQGGKGIISDIVPSDQMLKDGKGNPIDVLLSPLTVISRTNPDQVPVAALGKIAAKTGKSYKLPSTMDEDLIEYTLKELRANNMSDTETIYNPKTGKEIKDVFVGNLYHMVAPYTAESKGKSRSTGFYSFDDEPGRGGPEGAKHFNRMGIQALLAHQADKTLKDMLLIKGQKNTDFWRNVKLGKTPSQPKDPLVYDKLKNLLTGVGISIKSDGSSENIFGMTDKDVINLTRNNRIQNSKTFSDKSMLPIEGGLFSPEITGFSKAGEKWSYISLPIKVPNPVMEQSLASILNVSQKEYNNVLKGESSLKGKVGPNAINEALKTIDLDKIIKESRKATESGSETVRNKAVKRLHYAIGMKQQGIHPSEFMMSRIPVLPPKFRPIITMGDKMRITSDMNYIYKDFIGFLEDYNDAKADKTLPKEISEGIVNDLYGEYKALTGLVEPTNTKLTQKSIGGIFKQLLGNDSIKQSFIQRRVIASNTDLSGLAVASPDPSLKLDEVAIPEKKAWELYKPYIIRDLVQSGMPSAKANILVEANDSSIRKSLLDVMSKRPVIINRAPTLHKYSLMAFKPKLSKDDTLHVNPSIVTPFNLDFDGDSMLITTKIIVNSEEAETFLKKHGKSICIIDNATVYYPHKQENHINSNEETGMYSKKTTVATTSMDIRISDIPHIKESKVEKGNITEWDVPEGIYIHSLDRATRISKVLPVTKFSEHRDVEMYDVCIGSSYKSTITCSEDGSLIVYDSGELKIVTPKEAIGKLVPKLQDMSLKGPSEHINRFIRIGNQIPASFDLGSFIGSIIGDGWIDCEGVTYIASNYSELRNSLIDFVDSSNIPQNSSSYTQCNDSKRWRSSEAYKVNFHLTQNAAKDLKTLLGSGAENKTIPWQSLKSSYTHQLGLLVGLISTDGTVNITPPAKGKKTSSKNISYDTVSPYLRDTFTTLCTKLGIRTNTTPYTGTMSGNNCYRITLSLGDVKRVYVKYNKFRLLNNAKQEALERIVEEIDLDAPHIAKHDMVPYPSHLTNELSWLGISKIVKPSEGSRFKKTGCMKRNIALELIEISEDADWEIYKSPTYLKKEDRTNRSPKDAQRLFKEWSELIKKNDLTWQPVTDIKAIGKQTCYDITVPETFTFATSNGIIVQDTMAYSVPATKDAIEEAYEKMLPSKNLLSDSNSRPNYVPEKEHVQGLYLASQNNSDKSVKYFKDIQEMLNAYNKGTLDIHDPVILS